MAKLKALFLKKEKGSEEKEVMPIAAE